MASLSEQPRDRPVLEITTAMIDAGVEALCEMRFGESHRDIVERVWVSMTSEIDGIFEQIANVG